MLVTIQPTSGLEIEKVVVDAPKFTISGSPLFYGKGSEAAAFHVKIFDDEGKLLNGSILKIRGRDAKPYFQDRTAPVKPSMEQPHKRKGKVAAPASQ